MLNRIVIRCRLTRDPELRRTRSGAAVCSVRVANERDMPNQETGKRDTDYFDVIAWNKTGEFLQKHFRKGSDMIVGGRCQMRKWKDNQGADHTTTEIIADFLDFSGSPSAAQTEAPDWTYQTNKPNRDRPEAERAERHRGAMPTNGYSQNVLGEPQSPQEDFAELTGDDYQLPF